MRPPLPPVASICSTRGLAADIYGLDDSRALRDLHSVMRWIGTALYTALAPNRFRDFWRD
jgi:hypothetical protein